MPESRKLGILGCRKRYVCYGRRPGKSVGRILFSGY
jgi:hypothetical protein